MSIFINLKKASYFPNLPDGIYLFSGNLTMSRPEADEAEEEEEKKEKEESFFLPYMFNYQKKKGTL